MNRKDFDISHSKPEPTPVNASLKTVQVLMVFFAGLVIIYGIFSPWLSVGTVFSMSSSKGKQGLILFANSFFLLLTSASYFFPLSQLTPLRKQIRSITYLLSLSSLGTLIYFYSKIDAIATDFLDSIAARIGLGNSIFDALLQPLINKLAATIQPEIGIGFYASAFGVLLGLIATVALGRRQ